MTPEQAADDEYCAETTMLDTYTALARPEVGPGLVQRRVFGDAELEEAQREALSSPERIAYIQRRAKEIRAERLAARPHPVPSTTNKPGTHAAMGALFNAAEEAIGRALRPEERAEFMTWMQTRLAPEPLDAEAEHSGPPAPIGRLTDTAPPEMGS